jgi:PAS domain-containing protein
LDPLVTINAEGQITDGNHALMNVTGIQRENLIEQTFPSILQSLNAPDKLIFKYLKSFVSD